MAAPHQTASTAGVDPDAAERRRILNETATDRLRGDFPHELSIPYGRHSRQVFDCYLPVGTPKGPVMVFLHGGGFRLGAPGPVAHYGRPILEQGGIFVSLGYRLAPEMRFPDTAEDAELGLEAVAKHVAASGGDRERLFLAGHSAGAALAAFVALRPATPVTAALRGLVLVSGMYDFTRLSEEVGHRSSARLSSGAASVL